MEFKKLLCKGKILFITGCMLILMVYVCYLITKVIDDVQAATTSYDYYQNLIYLIGDIASMYFSCIFVLMVFLTYFNKQYSKWCIRVYYLMGVSALLYFGFADIFRKNVFNHIEPQDIKDFSRMVHTLYTAPLFSMIVGYFFTPKILKDAQKLKEEQELTI